MAFQTHPVQDDSVEQPCGSPDDADVLTDLYTVLDFLRVQRPNRLEFFRSRILGNPVDEVDRFAVARVNDIISAYSGFGIDTTSEDILVKIAMRLGAPDKALGGNDILILATTFGSFLYSLAIILGTLVKQDSERELLKAPISSERKKYIAAAMQSVEAEITALRRQVDEITQGV